MELFSDRFVRTDIEASFVCFERKRLPLLNLLLKASLVEFSISLVKVCKSVPTSAIN